VVDKMGLDFDYNYVRQDNIIVFYKEKSYIDETINGIKEAQETLSKYFELTLAKHNIRVVLTPSRLEFDKQVLNFLKISSETPSRRSRIAQPQGTDLVLLSPSAYFLDSIYRYNYEEYARLLCHELTHIYHELLSPDMETVPRWFSEGLAIYLSEQWIYEDEFRLPVASGNIPTLDEINEDINLAYEWGWPIIKYIDDLYGKETILRCIKEQNYQKLTIFMRDEIEEIGEISREWISR
jgi:hypothetical protein